MPNLLIALWGAAPDLLMWVVWILAALAGGVACELRYRHGRNHRR